jgi:hypothetical protein
MRMEEIREFANALGIIGTNRFQHEDDLVRTIQLEMGVKDCYNSDMGCSNPIGKCLFKEFCRNHDPNANH